jgi:NADPH2:quinone reductase
VIHAAAGGVGSIACQWAKRLGATVIGTVGTPEKAALARSHGCDHPILYRDEDFVARVREITGGAGVPVVYDSVGRDSFLRSLDCLAPHGILVSFGQSSGAVAPFDIGVLATKGSLYLTRPTLLTFIARPDELREAARELFDLVLERAVHVEVRQTYALADAARAHRDLESRSTSGSSILLP